MADQQTDHEVAIPLVQDRHPLQAERVLQPRQPRHEEQLPEDEVGSEQPCHPAEAVECIGCVAGDLEAGAEPPEAEDHDRVECEQGVDNVRPRPDRTGSNSAGHEFGREDVASCFTLTAPTLARVHWRWIGERGVRAPIRLQSGVPNIDCRKPQIGRDQRPASRVIHIRGFRQ